MQKHEKTVVPVSRESKIILSESDIARFWKKVNKGPHPQGCWLWTGYKKGTGYGCFTKGKSTQFATHRISFTIHNGGIPAGLLVMHKCDNRPCVRPSHLEVGTYADNSRDMVQKGRSATGDRHSSRLYPGIRAGVLSGHAILTEKDIRVIRSRPRFYGYIKQLERDFPEVKKVTLEKILGGKTWRHIK